MVGLEAKGNNWKEDFHSIPEGAEERHVTTSTITTMNDSNVFEDTLKLQKANQLLTLMARDEI